MAEPFNGEYSDRMWELLFAVRRSIRYHDRRQRFFSQCHRLVSAIWIVSGAAIFGEIFGNHKLLVILPTIAAVADIVIGFAQQMSEHKVLKQKFMQLETQIISNPDDSNHADFYSKRVAIESGEPPKLHALDLLCHNEVVHAYYSREDAKEHLAEIKWFHRRFAQFRAWPNAADTIGSSHSRTEAY